MNQPNTQRQRDKSLIATIAFLIIIIADVLIAYTLILPALPANEGSVTDYVCSWIQPDDNANDNIQTSSSDNVVEAVA